MSASRDLEASDKEAICVIVEAQSMYDMKPKPVQILMYLCFL